MLRPLVALGSIALLLAAPAQAIELSASSAASSASESVATSVGSLSNSVAGSSNSSAGDNKVAEGDYRVRAVAALADRPGLVQVTLQAVAIDGAGGEIRLTLPQATAERARLATGGTVHVKQRSFGLEFAQGPAREAFFLAVADEWLRDLATRPVTL
jgi:hypothetical protein